MQHHPFFEHCDFTLDASSNLATMLGFKLLELEKAL
jgi:hypothetical protein